MRSGRRKQSWLLLHYNRQKWISNWRSFLAIYPLIGMDLPVQMFILTSTLNAPFSSWTVSHSHNLGGHSLGQPILQHLGPAAHIPRHTPQ